MDYYVRRLHAVLLIFDRGHHHVSERRQHRLHRLRWRYRRVLCSAAGVQLAVDPQLLSAGGRRAHVPVLAHQHVRQHVHVHVQRGLHGRQHDARVRPHHVAVLQRGAHVHRLRERPVLPRRHQLLRLPRRLIRGCGKHRLHLLHLLWPVPPRILLSTR